MRSIKISAGLLVALFAAVAESSDCKKEIVDVFPYWGAGDGWLATRVFNPYIGEAQAYENTVSEKGHHRSVLHYTPGLTPYRRSGIEADPTTGCFNGRVYASQRPTVDLPAGQEFHISNPMMNYWYRHINDADKDYDNKTPASTFAILKSIIRDRAHPYAMNVIAWLHRTPQFGSTDLDVAKLGGCATEQLPTLKQLSKELSARSGGNLIWLRSNDGVDYSGITGFDNMVVVDIDVSLPMGERLQPVRDALKLYDGRMTDVHVIVEGTNGAHEWNSPFLEATWLSEKGEMALNQHWTVTYTKDFEGNMCYLPVSDVGQSILDFKTAGGLYWYQNNLLSHAMSMTLLKLGDDRRNQGPIVLLVSSGRLPAWADSDEWEPTARCISGGMKTPSREQFSKIVDRYNVLVYVGAKNDTNADAWIESLSFLDPRRVIVSTETDFETINHKITSRIGDHLAASNTQFTAGILGGPNYNDDFIDTVWYSNFDGEKSAHGFMSAGSDGFSVDSDACWFYRGHRDGMPFRVQWGQVNDRQGKDLAKVDDNPLTYAIVKAKLAGPGTWEAIYVRTNRKPTFREESEERDFNGVRCSEHISPTKEEFQKIIGPYKGNQCMVLIESDDADVIAAWKDVPGVDVNDPWQAPAKLHMWTHYIVDASSDPMDLANVMTRELYSPNVRFSLVGDWEDEGGNPACLINGVGLPGGKKVPFYAEGINSNGAFFGANDHSWQGALRGTEYGLYRTLSAMQASIPADAYGPPVVNFWVEKKPRFDKECLGPNVASCLDVARICVQDIIDVSKAAAENIEKLNFVGPEADAWKELFGDALAPIAVDSLTLNEDDNVIGTLENFMCGTDEEVSEFSYPTFVQEPTTTTTTTAATTTTTTPEPTTTTTTTPTTTTTTTTTTPEPTTTTTPTTMEADGPSTTDKAADEGKENKGIFLGAFIAA